MTKHYAVLVAAGLTVAKLLGIGTTSWGLIVTIYLLGFFVGTFIEAVLVEYYDRKED